MNAGDIVKQIIGRAFEIMDGYGLGPGAFNEIQQEATKLSQILLDANATPEAKDAARKALRSIPIRIKEQAVTAREDVLGRLRFIGDTLVRVVLGIADLGA